MEALDGIQLKLERAEEHLARFHADFDPFRDSKSIGIRREPDPDPGYYQLIYERRRPFPPRLPVYLGDFVHNLRSALDHIAWALSRNPSSATEFPILSDHPVTGRNPKEAARQFRRKTIGISSEARTEMERLQPYHKGYATKGEPLWRIHRLDIEDKHHALVVVTPHLRICTKTGTWSLWGNFDDGRQVARFRLGDDPGEFEPTFAIDVLPDEASSSFRFMETSALDTLHKCVRDDVLPRFTRFFS